MPRRYRHIKEYEKKMLELKSQGKTNREICEKFGIELKQLKNFITRYNTTQRKIEAGIAIKRKGRPPKDCSVSEQDKVTAELQLHSDQGFQYTSHGYGITPSMSRRGNPYDNALAENFFSILNKTECLHRVKLQTYEEARLLIDEYIYFYNNERIQLKTKLTPMEYRNQFVA